MQVASIAEYFLSFGLHLVIISLENHFMVFFRVSLKTGFTIHVSIKWGKSLHLHVLPYFACASTVNPEIYAIILFLRKTLKDTFVTLKFETRA